MLRSIQLCISDLYLIRNKKSSKFVKMKTNLAIISSVSEPRYRIILIGNETVSAKRREYKWLRYGSRVRGGDHLNLSLTALEKRQQMERERRVWSTFDSLLVDGVLAPWLIHWLAHLQLARDTTIRHSVMSQCYKYSHAFPTTFLPSRNCLSPKLSFPRPYLRAILVSPTTYIYIRIA